MKLENKNQSQLVKEADKWFSLYIRERDNKKYGVCVICGSQPIEHAFHWVGRQHHSTRFNEFNACGSCAGCNLNMKYDPAKFYIWFQNKHPGRLERLVKLSKLTKKIDRYKLLKIIEKYKRRYNSLKTNL